MMDLRCLLAQPPSRCQRQFVELEGLKMSSDDMPAGGDSGGEVQDSTAINIKVKSLNGADFEMEIPRDILVSQLKTRVREQTEVDEV